MRLVGFLSYLILKHLFEVLAGFRVPHLNLGNHLSQGDTAAWNGWSGVFQHVDWQLNRVLLRLKVLCVFFLFSHENILVDVLPVNQILLVTSPLHAFEVTNLLYREIVGLKLVRLLIVRKTLVILF